MNNKIGVAITTCNRSAFLDRLLKSLCTQDENIHELIVINDGKEITDIDISHVAHINNKTNLGVGKSKNKGIKYLYDKGCEYIFVVEDDMLILDQSIFQRYIEACKITGIQHFNYGPGSPFNRKQTIEGFDLHNRHLLDQESEPNPRLIVDYKTCKLALYTHITGMFSFFTREVIENVGYIDESYKNAWEHVDHTYQIIKSGYHPPFWWFADIADSHHFIQPQKDAIGNSSTSKNTTEWIENVQANAEKYKIKNGHYPAAAPQVSQTEVIKFLKNLKP